MGTCGTVSIRDGIIVKKRMRCGLKQVSSSKLEVGLYRVGKIVGRFLLMQGGKAAAMPIIRYTCHFSHSGFWPV